MDGLSGRNPTLCTPICRFLKRFSMDGWQRALPETAEPLGFGKEKAMNGDYISKGV
jgi:hypothetical protein